MPRKVLESGSFVSREGFCLLGCVSPYLQRSLAQAPLSNEAIEVIAQNLNDLFAQHGGTDEWKKDLLLLDGEDKSAAFLRYLERVRDRDFMPVCRRDVNRCALNAMMRGAGLVGDVGLFSGMVVGFERWFFEHWMVQITADVAELISQINEDASADLVSTSLERLYEVVREASTVKTVFKSIVDNLRGTADRSSSPSSFKQGSLWGLISDADGISHDIGNIVSAHLIAVDMAWRFGAAYGTTRCLEAIQERDLSTANSAARLAANMSRSRAKRHEVELNVGSFANFQLPDELRVDFFRVIYELITNAIKYGKAEGEEGKVSIESSLIGSYLYVHVSDNGVGISDLKNLAYSCLEGGGMRERPDLAEGDGRGMATVAKLARRNGWGFFVASAKGVGTDAGIYFDLSSILTRGYSLVQEDDGGDPSQLFLEEIKPAPNDIFDIIMRSGALPQGLADSPSFLQFDSAGISCFNLAPISVLPVGIAM